MQPRLGQAGSGILPGHRGGDICGGISVASVCGSPGKYRIAIVGLNSFLVSG